MGFSIGYFCSIRSNLLASAQICQLFENELMSTLKKKLFVAFPWVETSTGPGGFMICVFII